MVHGAAKSGTRLSDWAILDDIISQWKKFYKDLQIGAHSYIYCNFLCNIQICCILLWISKRCFCNNIVFSPEKAMAPYSSTLAWKIPWTEEPGRLQSMGSLRVGHDWATSLSLSPIGEGNGNSLQCSCLENPRDGGAWWAAVYGAAQSRTRLKQLSSSSSSLFHINF